MDRAVRTLSAMFVPAGSTPIPNGLPAINSMHRVLLGLQPLGVLEFNTTDTLGWFDLNLDDSQKRVIKFALESPEVACIWGPPGSSISLGSQSR
jgi:DNA polymerase alpha-associated DNA helicase A